MPTQINGLPAHVLLIHVIVVLVPLGALFTVLSAVWPAAHRKLGFISPLTCLISLVLVPVTTNAGEWLDDKLTENGPNPAIAKHADLGETFLWYVLPLFAVSAAVWWFGRTYELSALASVGAKDEPARDGGSGAVTTATRTQATKTVLPVWATVAIDVVVVAVAVLVVVQLYRIGDSGAHAAWNYVKNQ